MGRKLWTPEGMVDTSEKDVIPLLRLEVITLGHLHELSQKYGLALVCKKCDSAILGKNNDGPEVSVVSVACQCREFRYVRGT